MDELRKELDLIDNELIKLVSKRFKFIEQAAIIKDDISKIRDNERIDAIIVRLRNYIDKEIIDQAVNFAFVLSLANSEGLTSSTNILLLNCI